MKESLLSTHPCIHLSASGIQSNLGIERQRTQVGPLGWEKHDWAKVVYRFSGPFTPKHFVWQSLAFGNDTKKVNRDTLIVYAPSDYVGRRSAPSFFSFERLQLSEKERRSKRVSSQNADLKIPSREGQKKGVWYVSNCVASTFHISSTVTL